MRWKRANFSKRAVDVLYDGEAQSNGAGKGKCRSFESQCDPEGPSKALAQDDRFGGWREVRRRIRAPCFHSEPAVQSKSPARRIFHTKRDSSRRGTAQNDGEKAGSAIKAGGAKGSGERRERLRTEVATRKAKRRREILRAKGSPQNDEKKAGNARKSGRCKRSAGPQDDGRGPLSGVAQGAQHAVGRKGHFAQPDAQRIVNGVANRRTGGN